MRTDFNELRQALLAGGPGHNLHVPALLSVCRPGAENSSQRADEPRDDSNGAARKASTRGSELLAATPIRPNGPA